MGKRDKKAVDADQACRCCESSADAYSIAVRVLEGVLLGLEDAGLATSERCDALGYTLINLLANHYTEEQALLLLETLHSTLKEYYEADLRP